MHDNWLTAVGAAMTGGLWRWRRGYALPRCVVRRETLYLQRLHASLNIRGVDETRMVGQDSGRSQVFVVSKATMDRQDTDARVAVADVLTRLPYQTWSMVIAYVVTTAKWLVDRCYRCTVHRAIGLLLPQSTWLLSAAARSRVASSHGAACGSLILS